MIVDKYHTNKCVAEPITSNIDKYHTDK